MKKIIAIILTLVLALSLFSGCKKNEKPEVIKIRIGYMAGPTGMGMAKFISDNGGLEGNEKYVFTKYADTAAAKYDLAAGNIDIICLPTNEAAEYHATVDDTAKILAINCLNSLYVMTDSSLAAPTLLDLEGHTVYTCKNGTPKSIIEHLIKEAKIDVKVSCEFEGKEIISPKDLSALVTSGKISVAVMPEPLVTSSLLEIKKNGDPTIDFSVDMDLGKEWAKFESTPIAMGCILADGDFARDRAEELDAFLSEYKASVEYIGNPANIDSAANYVVETGVMGAAPAAKMALKNLGNAISYIDGAEMKEVLVAFYNITGITLPSDSFYYGK